MPLPSLTRLALPTARPFGPIVAEPDEPEGIVYKLNLPDEWAIRTPPGRGPLRVVGRGMNATAVAATASGEAVVVLVRPLDALLPQETDCPATRRVSEQPDSDGWMDDCLKLREDKYEEEIAEILALMETLEGATPPLLPKLHDNGIVDGTTENAPREEFEAVRFGVQVWQQMTTTIENYIKDNGVTRKQFIDNLMPKIQQSCARLDRLGLQHFDLHLNNVAVNLNDGVMSDVVFLDPASIRKAEPWYVQCEGQSLVNEFDLITR